MDDSTAPTTWSSRPAVWLPLLSLLLILTACAGSDGDPPAPVAKSTSGQVETLSGEADLEAYLKTQYARSVNVHLDLPGGGAAETDAGRPADDAAPAPTDGDYTQTNVQERGVDEADVVKSDGRHFYVASGDTIQVVAVGPPMRLVASEAAAGEVAALYLHGDKLVVLFDTWQGAGGWEPIDLPAPGQRFGMPCWLPPAARQGVSVYDVSDPGRPALLRTVDIDGYRVSSRLIDGKLHLVQQFMPILPPLEHWYDGSASALEEIVAANLAAMDALSLAQLIPHYREVAADGTAQPEMPLVTPERFYCPTSKNGGGTITTVVSFDLDDPALPFTSAGIVADAHIVYATADSLYTATHRHLHGREISEETTLYQFDLSGDGATYTAGGVIPGWILNQFSLGEHEGVLRVATTTGHAGGWGGSLSSNRVYCLRAEGETLNIIGKLEDLAPGEQIYAARFMGARGYLVTFVNIDPLFTLDLSDPSAPFVAGELKVPGYSDYIHPYGEDYLITVGKDAIPVAEHNMAWYQGLQLSVFDVSDFADPRLLHKEIIGDRGTGSEASYNHKAFTFWPGRELLALPVDLFEHAAPPAEPWEYGTRTFSGLYVYQLSSENGFSLLGRISTENENGPGMWTRGVFNEDRVYALTNNAIRSTPIDPIQDIPQVIYFNP